MRSNMIMGGVGRVRKSSGGGGGGNTFALALAGPASTTGAGSTIASTFGGSTSVGHLRVAVITQTWGANSPKTITNVRDNVDGANDYTPLAEINNGGNLYVHIYARVATSAGTATVTCTFSGTADATIAVNAYSATAGFTADVTATNTGTGTSITPGSVTPTGDALYIAAAVWANGNGAAFTTTAGWAARQERESGSSSLIGVQDFINGTGAKNPAMTLDQSLTWAAAIATYH